MKLNQVLQYIENYIHINEYEVNLIKNDIIGTIGLQGYAYIVIRQYIDNDYTVIVSDNYIKDFDCDIVSDTIFKIKKTNSYDYELKEV